VIHSENTYHDGKEEIARISRDGHDEGARTIPQGRDNRKTSSVRVRKRHRRNEQPQGNFRRCRGRRRVEENGKEKRPRKSMTTAFSPDATTPFETFFQGNFNFFSCIVKGPCTEL
jgi:hypothetical protein